MSFKPNFQITPEIIKYLVEIGVNKEVIQTFNTTPKLFASLRRTAKLTTTHYSTAIEGNMLTQEEVAGLIESNLKPKEKDEKEVMGY